MVTRRENLLRIFRHEVSEWLIYEQDRYPVSPLASAAVCVERCRAAGVIA